MEAGGGGGAGAALGSGAFGKVGTYRYHGAAVAVKELKTGADKASIGVFESATLYPESVSFRGPSVVGPVDCDVPVQLVSVACELRQSQSVTGCVLESVSFESLCFGRGVFVGH